MEENFCTTWSMISRMTDRTERFLPKSEMDIPERSSLSKAKDTPADNTAPLRQAPPSVANLLSPANSCAKKVKGIDVKDICSFSRERDVDFIYSGTKCISSSESLLTSPSNPAGRSGRMQGTIDLP